MLFKVETLCWEPCERKLPVEKTIYISGMPVNLNEKIKVGFFLKKKTDDRYIYYLIKSIWRLHPEEEEALSGICDINIDEFDLFLKHNRDTGNVFTNGSGIPFYCTNKNRTVYFCDLVRFLNEIKYFESGCGQYIYEFNLSYSNSIEKMDFSSVEECFKWTPKPSVCLEAYYWDNYQATGQMKTKYIRITGSFEKVRELIRMGVFFTLKQDNKESLGVVKRIFLVGKCDMSVNLEDIKILFTPKGELVLDSQAKYFLNGEACCCDLADSLCKTTFSDNDGRIYLFNNNGRSFFDRDVSASLILKTWFSPKINCLNISKDDIALLAREDENTPHYIMNSYDTVQSISSQACYAWGEREKKEEHNMFNNLMKNLEFGKINTNAIKYSFNGIAFATNDGSYVVYNSDMTFTNVSDMVMDIPIYAMPVAKSDIEVGDIIKHHDTFVIVQSITDTEIRVANPLTREVVNIIPEKSIFGFDFYSKVIDFTKNFNTGATESNPFGNLPLLMMMDDKKDNGALMYFMMNNAGKMDFSNPMMMYLMMSNSDDKSNLLPLLLMSQNKEKKKK